MKRLWLVVGLVVVAAGGTGARSAPLQRPLAVVAEATMTPVGPIAGGWTEVVYGEHTYALDPSVPEQAYVTAVTTDLDGTWATLVFFRHTAAGFEPTGEQTYEAAGVLTGVRSGDRLALLPVGD